MPSSLSLSIGFFVCALILGFSFPVLRTFAATKVTNTQSASVAGNPDRTGSWDAGSDSDGYSMVWVARDGRSVSIVCGDEATITVEFQVPGRATSKARMTLGSADHAGGLSGSPGRYLFEPGDAKSFLRDLGRPGRMVFEAGAARVEPAAPPQDMRSWFVRRCSEYWPWGQMAVSPAVKRSGDPALRAFAAARAGAPVTERTFRDQDDSGFQGPEMVALPPGSFVMGSPPGEGYDDERPQRPIKLTTPLAVGRYEVTWEEYSLCRYEGPCDAAPDDGFGGGRRPVTNVTFADAAAYAGWLSQRTGHAYRLLSEAEWEYAARAGSSTAYPWGPKLLPGKANCDGCGGSWNGKATAPVGTFPANAFGLHDMQGNVWEWVQDCFAGNYAAGQPRNGSAFQPKDCALRVIRGGSWNTTASRLRSSNRLQGVPTDRFREMGFRVARQ